MAHSLFQSPYMSWITEAKPSSIFGAQLRSPEIDQTHSRFRDRSERNLTMRLKASMESPRMAQQIVDNKQNPAALTTEAFNHFKELKQRFLSFKRDKYLKNLENYRRLAEAQSPKFMVIACADSRVCPSSILGFQPGEAFVVRNVANLVPPHEVGNILVVGHSCCGGIRALMSLEDDGKSSSFITNWVVVGKPAKLRTKTAASNLNFDQQCRHCEKESVNSSLLNLLTYPWIEEQVMRGNLMIHGGYYDFVDCTFEKWTLDYMGSSLGDGKCSIRNREFWT